LGWIGGLNSDYFFIKPASLSVEKVTSSADPPDASTWPNRYSTPATIRSRTSSPAMPPVVARKTTNDRFLGAGGLVTLSYHSCSWRRKWQASRGVLPALTNSIAPRLA